MGTREAPTISESPLRVPIFRAIWVASIAGNFGTIIQSVGASWLMLSLSSSPQMVAMVQTAIALPVVLLALWAGAIADGIDRRLVLLGAQVMMLTVSTLLAIAAWLHVLSPWSLLALTFLVSAGYAVNSPAWQASTSDIVPREAISRAVALNSLGYNVARSVGPAIGGAIVGVAGASAAFAVNALSYIGLIVVLLRWRRPPDPETLPREPIGAAMAAGLRYVAMSPAIVTVLARAFLFGFAASVVQALLPLVARDVIRGGALTYGVLLNGFGAGAVAGALASAWLRKTLRAEHVVQLASLCTAVGAAGVGLSVYLIPSLIALFLAGAGWVVALTTFNVTVQMSAPRWVAGRALAIYQTAVFSGISGGSWMFGYLAAHLGLVMPLLVAAGGLLIVVLAGWVIPLPKVDALDLTPLRDWMDLKTPLPIDGRTGPLVVTITYRIADADIPAFLDAMSERRRIRRRDGARHWALMRDVAEPQRWVERYHVPTWHDYVRHNRRHTVEDAENFDRIRAMHVGDTPPSIHRMIERQPGWRLLRAGQMVRDVALITDTRIDREL